MQKLIKFETVSQLNAFFAGRRILITKGEWENEEADFVRMKAKGEVLKGQRPDSITMIVKTRFGTELELKQDEVFVIESKTYQNPKMN